MWVPYGTLSVLNGGEVQQTQRPGGFFLADGTMSVDGSSIAEAGTLGGAQTGFLTIDPNRCSGGIGTFNGNIVDNGNVDAKDGGGFEGNGTLKVNGFVTGTGFLTVGAQETLALNGAVNLTDNGSVDFFGWYGTLAIDKARRFFLDHADLQFHARRHDRPQERAVLSTASSYTFTYGSNGGPNDLKIKEGGQTVNLNLGSYTDLNGLLTLKADASGTGTDIVYTSGGESPLQPWGSPIPNFFTTASGPVDGSFWALSNSDDGAQPVWIETETPASSYVAGQSAPYTIVLTTQDWIGTQQPLVTVATTNLIDPFGSSSQSIGNLAGSVYVSNTYPTGTMDLIYWKASTTPGDYAVEFQPITTTYATGPTTGPSTVLTGGPTQIDAAVSQPLSWNLTNNYTGMAPRLRTCSAIPLSRPRRPRTSSCRAFQRQASRRPPFSRPRSRTEHGGPSATTRERKFLLRLLFGDRRLRGRALFRNFQSGHGPIGRPDRLSFDARIHERFGPGGHHAIRRDHTPVC